MAVQAYMLLLKKLLHQFKALGQPLGLHSCNCLFCILVNRALLSHTASNKDISTKGSLKAPRCTFCFELIGKGCIKCLEMTRENADGWVTFNCDLEDRRTLPLICMIGPGTTKNDADMVPLKHFSFVGVCVSIVWRDNEPLSRSSAQGKRSYNIILSTAAASLPGCLSGCVYRFLSKVYNRSKSHFKKYLESGSLVDK